MAETGHFASQWRALAERFKLEVDMIPGDWRRGASPEQIEAKLDRGPRASHQGGDGRAQRDLDRRDQPRRRYP